MQKLGSYVKELVVLKCTPGFPVRNDIEKLKSQAHAIVATPGRLLNLLELKSINLTTLKLFILDELDELYARGFEKQVELLRYIFWILVAFHVS